MRLLVLIACVASAVLAGPGTILRPELNSHWENFKTTYSKNYEGGDESLRRLIWEKNIAIIQSHNLEADRGLHTFRLGVNEYADLTSEEFANYLKGYVMHNATAASSFMAPTNVRIPESADWRTKGYVTAVKNQKQCGSCWAFAATGSLEGQHFRKSGKLISLSEQNLVDCSRKEGNAGCQGGLPSDAYRYIKANKGIDTEDSYPYTAKNGKCHFRRADVGATVTGYENIPQGNEVALKTAVATVGPIAVGIDAGHPSFQLYKTGVYYEKKCNPKDLDHGVLVVGYGTNDEGHDFWTVKNSWGPSWGEKGYIKMSRNRNNNCGIASQALYPLV